MAVPKDFLMPSYWYIPLPDNAPIRSDSAQAIAGLAAGTHNYLGLSIDSWSMPCYYPKPGDPIFFVADGQSLSGAGGYAGLDPILKPGGAGLRMPAGGLHGNNEGAMCIIDRTTFTNNGKTGGNWIVALHQHGAPDNGAQSWTGTTYRADGGGVFYRNTNGLDARVKGMYPNNTPPIPANPANSGSMRGCPNNVRSGIRKEDYLAGSLDRIIECFANNTGPSHVYPWVGDESGSVPALPEGCRIRIRPGVNVDQLAGPVGSARWVLAKGLQNFGMCVGDQSGATAVVKGEMNAWAGTNLTVSCLSGIPFNTTNWAAIQFGYEPSSSVLPPPPPAPPPPPPPAPPPPPPPATLPTIGVLSLGSQTATSVTLNWTAATATTADPVTRYTVYRVGSGAVATTTGTGRTATVSGLAAGTYQFQLTATNLAGESARSNTVTATLVAPAPPPPPPAPPPPGPPPAPPPPPPVTIPAAPTNLVWTAAGDGFVSLMWNDPSAVSPPPPPATAGIGPWGQGTWGQGVWGQDGA